MSNPIEPNNVICVVMHNGREVGRIAATAKNASDYIQEFARHYGSISVNYEEDADAAMISRMLSSPRF